MEKTTWADRLGAQPPPTTNPVGQAIDQMLRDGVESGIPPADVAARVAEAIRKDQFWILTHPEVAEMPVDRMRRAAAQENPA
jgi:hypothetical protein